jgi:hypothetical protein
MSDITAGVDINRSRPMTRDEKRVVLASAAGTIFESYDVYRYGSLAATCRADLRQNQLTRIVGCFGRSETEAAPGAVRPSHRANSRSSSRKWRGVEYDPTSEDRGSGRSCPGHRSRRRAGTWSQTVPHRRYRHAPPPQSVVAKAVSATGESAKTATATGDGNGCVFRRRESGQPWVGGR